MSEHLDYVATQVRNRETFLLNYGPDFHTFDSLLSALRSAWARLGSERDISGQSQAGLLPFVNILVRHSIFGFQHIASYQSFLAWLTFRPGLEALLMLGKLLDDPTNADIWRNRKADPDPYKRTFSSRALVSKSLPRSEDFQQVLKRLNDDFMHPNPDFTYRDMRVRDKGSELSIEIEFFDARTEIHEAHLLAYVNLIDLVVSSSEKVVTMLYGPTPAAPSARQAYAELEACRARVLATRDNLARKILGELGLWDF
jgi:hypothetical protein